jgi:hypothetical protein
MSIMSIILMLVWVGVLAASYWVAVYLLKKFDIY